MEDVWETWISSLEMDIGHSLDEDKFDIENVQQPSFSFEGSNNVKSSIHSISSNCLISQEHYDANSKQTPSQHLLPFENSCVKPSPNSAIATCSSIMDPKTTTLNHNESTLSATIPGLKKTDKVYILEEAIKYVKQLEEKIKELDNQNKMKNKYSEILIKKSQACTKKDDIDEDEYYFKKELPKVKARVINNEIMVGIHCEKQENTVVKIMGLLQNLHLSLASSSILPFGNSTLKVTIIAQMNDKYCMNTT
ncbi:unnamed protein product [Vicia faba]|uniref:Uncharacterized protein n=1 Tax=Vicia faba TaxID=3906 RepID=A0AAV1AFZ1_VICFA|nr:unnamed protein product [Vicia faba]